MNRLRVAEYALVQGIVMLTIGFVLYITSRVRYLPNYNDIVFVNYVNWPLYVWGQLLLILGATTFAVSGAGLLVRRAYMWIIRARTPQPQHQLAGLADEMGGADGGEEAGQHT